MAVPSPAAEMLSDLTLLYLPPRALPQIQIFSLCSGPTSDYCLFLLIMCPLARARGVSATPGESYLAKRVSPAGKPVPERGALPSRGSETAAVQTHPAFTLILSFIITRATLVIADKSEMWKNKKKTTKIPPTGKGCEQTFLQRRCINDR